jgi:hypothetical protein
MPFHSIHCSISRSFLAQLASFHVEFQTFALELKSINNNTEIHFHVKEVGSAVSERVWEQELVGFKSVFYFLCS